MNGEESVFEQFGRELRQARESRNRSIDEIAERTRINRRYIEAIENGDLSALPPGPYTRAFLREYARVVGLKVPTELAEIANTEESSSNVSIRKLAKRESPASDVRNTSKPGTTPKSPAAQPMNVAIKATKDTARIANNAAKTAARSAARTTETVIKRVESGAKDAVDVFTSKSLWEEAEQVRRERRGLAPLPETESAGSLAKPPDDLDIDDLRSRISGRAGRASENPAEDWSDRPSATVAASAGLSDASRDFETTQSIQDESAPEDEDANYSRGTRTPRSTRTGLLSTTNLVIFGIVLIFAAVIALALHQNEKQQTPETATVEQPEIAKEKPSSSVVTPVVPSVAPSPAPISSPDSLRFVLHALEGVWVSITPDSKVPFRGMLKPGEVRSFSAHDKFVVNIGNQRALEMTFNGQALSHLPTIANSGVVVRDLELTRDRVTLAGQAVPMGGTIPSATNSSSKPPVAAHGTLPSATPSKLVLPVKKVAAPTTKGSVHPPLTKLPPKTPAKNIGGSSKSKYSGSKPSAVEKRPSAQSAQKGHKKYKRNVPIKRFKSKIPMIDPVAPRP